MGALTQVYVDPAIDANSGSGTIGDPYGDLQHALNTLTFDTVNGTRISIVPGTAEVLTASLTIPFSPEGSSSHLVIESADPNVPAVIDGNNGGFTIYNGVKSAIFWQNLKIGNTGTATVLTLGLYSHAHRCEIHDGANGVVGNVSGGGIFGCHVHSCTNIGIVAAGPVVGNFLQNGISKKFIDAISAVGGGIVLQNIVSVDASSRGINPSTWYPYIQNNSIFSSGGSGVGIRFSGALAAYGISCINNTIEGFSGAGGVGLLVGADASHLSNNAVFNCDTNYSIADQVVIGSDNETLASSPFAKSGANTFANRFAYFALNDVGNVKDGAYPVGSNLSKGAVQFAGGGPSRPVNPFFQQVIG